MDKRKYQINNMSYICTAIDAETICQKADWILKSTIRDKAGREARINQLRVWCKSARPDEQLTLKEFTVSVQRINS